MGGGEVEVLRSAYAAWNEGDVERALEHFDPELEWRPGADDPHGGAHQGRDGFGRWTRSWGASFDRLRLDPGAPCAVGDWLVTEVSQRGRPWGSTVDVESTAAHAWRVEGGRATAWYSFRDIEEALELVAGPETCARLTMALRGYDAFNRGDVEASLETIHPDIEWHTYIVPGPGGGTYRGHEGVRELWSEAKRVFGGFKNIPERLVDAGDQVVAFVRVEGVGTQSGAPVEARIAHLFSFAEDKVIRIESFADRGEALRAAGVEAGQA